MYTDAAAPLLLEQALTIVSPAQDDGIGTPSVVADFLAQHPRVFV